MTKKDYIVIAEALRITVNRTRIDEKAEGGTYVIAANAASLSQVQEIVSGLIHRSRARIKQQFIWDTTTRKGRNYGKSKQV
jgi:hypothetical protein